MLSRILVVFTVFVLFSSFAVKGYSQPVNDVCTGAIPIVAGTNPLGFGPTMTVTFTPDVTASGAAPSNCNVTEQDLWYSHVVTTTNIFFTASSAAVSAYASCADATAGNALGCASGSTSLRLGTLTIGQTIYLRVASVNGVANKNLNFQIFNLPEDNCMGVTPVPISGNVFAPFPIGYSAFSGTQNCGPNSNTPDSWFAFIAPASGVVSLGTFSNLGTFGTSATVYSGTCGALTQIGCLSIGTDFFLGGLTPNTTYYVQFVAANPNTPNRSNSTIRFEASIPNPTCELAIGAPVRPAGFGCSTPSSTTFTSLSAGVGSSSWYSWTATTDGLLVTSSSFSRVRVQVYSGSCSGLVQLSDFRATTNNLQAILTGWNITDQVFIRVSGNNNSQSSFQGIGSFCLEEFTLPPPPVNDECGGALVLTLGQNTMGNSAGATISAGITGCGSPGFDVWYQFVAPPSGIVQTSPGHEVYSGTCGSLTGIGCSSITQGLTPGVTYFLRISTQDYSVDNPFTTLVTEVAPPPINNNCFSAIPAPVLLEDLCDVSGNAQIIDLSGGVTRSGSCNASTGNTSIFYTYTAVTNAINFTADPGINLVVNQGTCGGLFQVSCNTSSGVVSLNQGTSYIFEIVAPKTTVEFCMEETWIGPRPVASASGGGGCSVTISRVVNGSSGSPALVDFYLPDGSIFGTLSSEEDLGSVSMTYFDNGGARAIPGTASDFDLGRSLTITSTNSPTLGVDVTLYALSSEVIALINADGNIGSIADLIVSHVSSSNCSATYDGSGTGLSPIVSNYGSEISISFSTPSFSEFFVVGASAPLPISLTSFSGQTKGSKNVLTWSTALELDHKGYFVERLIEANTSGLEENVTLDFIPTSGNSLGNTYTYVDQKPQAISLYRLRSVDLDGSETLSSIISVKNESVFVDLVSLRPSIIPENSSVKVIVDPSLIPCEGAIYNSNGKLVKRKTFQSPTNILSSIDMRSGLYTFRIESGKASGTVKRLMVW